MSRLQNSHGRFTTFILNIFPYDEHLTKFVCTNESCVASAVELEMQHWISFYKPLIRMPKNTQEHKEHIWEIYVGLLLNRIADISVSTGTGYRLDDPGAVPGRERFLSSLHRPYRLRGSHSLLFNSYRERFPWGQSGLDVKLTTHLHQVLRSRKVELYFHSPICLRGTVLIWLSTGTTLLLDTIGFWRWCITHRDIGFSDFVHRPDFS
jgi:hypothetical protein